MKLSIKTLNGELFSIEVEETEKVIDIKVKIQNTKAILSAERQKLIHAGKVLKDEQSVTELGLKESDFIVCMVTKEVLKKTTAVAESSPITPAAAPLPVPVAVPAASISPVIVAPPLPNTTDASSNNVSAPSQSSDNSAATKESLQSLISMGFPEKECRAALVASNGNPDLAYEFLLTGIPDTTPSTPRINSDGVEQLRQHPQLNMLKQLVQQNPAALPQVLDLIGQQNPALLASIHENNEAFIALMNEPISETATNTQPPISGNMNSRSTLDSGDPAQIIQMLASLPPAQRAQVAQSIGISPDQLEGFMSMMSALPSGDGRNVFGGGAVDPPGVIRLTEDEMEAVNRLVALGFSQQQAAQAYLACDKNEALAANLLLEGGWGDDDGDDGHDDDMYN